MAFFSWRQLVRRWLVEAGQARSQAKKATVRPRLEELEERRLLSTFLVTTTADSGDGSFRQAIIDSNTTVGLDTIDFSISSGSQTITLTSGALPTITDAVIIDGSSQPGFASTPIINLNGGSLTAGTFNGLTINSDGSGSTIQDLAIENFTGSAILIDGSSANLITGNYLGINSNLSSVGNGIAITIQNGSFGNTVGGTTSADQNVISANIGAGIDIQGSSTFDNLVEGNFIGVSPSGTVGMGNGEQGIRIHSGSFSNTIGGTQSGAGNVISASRNNFSGINILDSGTTGNLIQGNLIGTDAGGNNGLGNSLDGVHIQNGAAFNTIGGTEVGAGNVLADNGRDGVMLDSGAFGNVVQGNFIGTNSASATALGNGANGVEVEVGAFGNTIGGTASGVRNVISGNGVFGVVLGGSGTTGNIVAGNYIGTDASGTSALANIDGVVIFETSGNTIGGTEAGAGNVISGNSVDGIWIDSGINGNLVAGNFIGTNAAGSSALGNGHFGVDIFSFGGFGGSDNTISGNVVSGNGIFGVVLDGAGVTGTLIEGNRIGTNAAGNSAIANSFDGIEVIGGANRNSIGGPAPGAGNLISGNDRYGILIFESGASGNLIQGNLIGTNAAITAALGNAVGVALVFGTDDNTIGGTASGAGNVISGNSDLGMWIFGQPGQEVTGNVIQGNRIGTDVSPTPFVVVNAVGIEILGDSQANTIGGTASGAGNTISRNILYGVFIEGSGATGNLVQGSQISGNTRYGVFVTDQANFNTVGGTAAGAGNTLTGNNLGGIQFGTDPALGFTVPPGPNNVQVGNTIV